MSIKKGKSRSPSGLGQYRHKVNKFLEYQPIANFTNV